MRSPSRASHALRRPAWHASAVRKTCAWDSMRVLALPVVRRRSPPSTQAYAARALPISSCHSLLSRIATRTHEFPLTRPGVVPIFADSSLVAHDARGCACAAVSAVGSAFARCDRWYVLCTNRLGDQRVTRERRERVRCVTPATRLSAGSGFRYVRALSGPCIARRCLLRGPRAF